MHYKHLIMRTIKRLFIATSNPAISSWRRHCKSCRLWYRKSIDSQTQTETGILKGTLNYMAPEPSGSTAATASSDIYALGLSLWELLWRCGLSFRFADDKSQLAYEPPHQWYTHIPTDVPEKIAQAIMKMCAREIEVRPRTAKDVASLEFQFRFGASLVLFSIRSRGSPAKRRNSRGHGNLCPSPQAWDYRSKSLHRSNLESHWTFRVCP